MHSASPNDNYKTISKRYYEDEGYAAALEAYNRDNPANGRYVRIPPIEVLLKLYPKVRAKAPLRATSGNTPASLSLQSEGNPMPVAAREDPVYAVADGGETLRDIAQKTLGSGEYWRIIYDLNSSLNPAEKLPPGTNCACRRKHGCSEQSHPSLTLPARVGHARGRFSLQLLRQRINLIADVARLPLPPKERPLPPGFDDPLVLLILGMTALFVLIIRWRVNAFLALIAAAHARGPAVATRHPANARAGRVPEARRGAVGGRLSRNNEERFKAYDKSAGAIPRGELTAENSQPRLQLTNAPIWSHRLSAG